MSHTFRLCSANPSEFYDAPILNVSYTVQSHSCGNYFTFMGRMH